MNQSLTIKGIKNERFVIRNGILIKYTGKDTDVLIPDGVTKIGYQAFSDCENLTIITIPGSVTSIGENAFYGCKNLKDVYISEKTVKLGKEILGKYDSDISCHPVKPSDVHVYTPAGSAAEKYMKQYSGVCVVNDYGEDK